MLNSITLLNSITITVSFVTGGGVVAAEVKDSRRELVRIRSTAYIRYICDVGMLVRIRSTAFTQYRCGVCMVIAQ
jgi:hypothetical protein